MLIIYNSNCKDNIKKKKEIELLLSKTLVKYSLCDSFHKNADQVLHVPINEKDYILKVLISKIVIIIDENINYTKSNKQQILIRYSDNKHFSEEELVDYILASQYDNNNDRSIGISELNDIISNIDFHKPTLLLQVTSDNIINIKSNSGLNDLLEISTNIGFFDNYINFMPHSFDILLLPGSKFYDSFEEHYGFEDGDCYIEQNGVISKFNIDDPESSLGDILVISNYKKILDNYSKRYDTSDNKVSIIIPHFNTNIDLLVRCINSAVNSGYENQEVIIVDDGSEVDLSNDILKKYPTVNWYTKKNEGLGLTRNFGVKKATGKYVLFLDSDDYIFDNCFHHIITHMNKENVKVCFGKRIIKNDDETILNSSLDYLFSKSYINYTSKNILRLGVDGMVTNVFYDKDIFFDENIWFEKGYYEDYLFKYKIHNYINKGNAISYLNIPLYCWIRYTKRETITNRFQYEVIKDRISTLGKIVAPMMYLDRKQIIKEFHEYHIKYYLDNLNQFDYPDKVISALNEINKRYNEPLISNDSSKTKENIKITTAYFVSTHYQLITAILHTLENPEENTGLYVYKGLGLENISEQIPKIKIFDEIKIFNYDETSILKSKLEENPNEANLIFPTVINPKYRLLLKNLNSDCKINIFRGNLPILYYLYHTFGSINKLEDAYCSFENEQYIKNNIGEYGRVINYFTPKIYPCADNYTSKKYQSIVVNKIPDNVKEETIREKMIEIDNIELFQKHKKTINEIFNVLYGKLDIKNGKDIVLTQPLAASSYCSKQEQKKLYSKTIKKIPFFRFKKFYFKPHPSDKVNYKRMLKYTGGKIIDKNIPLEYLVFSGVTFKKAYTFGSTGINFLNCKKKYIICEVPTSTEHVKEEIQKYIKNY
ncbi:MAG: glycosyltransferase [Anaerorhabdus sp.]